MSHSEDIKVVKASLNHIELNPLKCISEFLILILSCHSVNYIEYLVRDKLT